MPTQMTDLLDELFNKNKVTQSLEKTAEARLLAGLQGEQVSANPYDEMSTEELAELALALEGEKTASLQEPEVPEEVLEKIAMDAIGGTVMAHAMLNEFGLIKEAMAQGLCRLCKANPMDVPGHSLCSGCEPASS